MVLAETSTFGILDGRNVRGRNVLAEMSVAEKSVAEISYIRIYHVFPFPFENGYRFQTFFFDHNVRYGSSVTFRIGVASESLQNLDNHEPQRFDFCNECKPTE